MYIGALACKMVSRSYCNLNVTRLREISSNCMLSGNLEQQLQLPSLTLITKKDFRVALRRPFQFTPHFCVRRFSKVQYSLLADNSALLLFVLLFILV